MNPFYKLKIKDIYNFLRTTEKSFWFVSLYLFFEYVRPQTLYPFIDILPFVPIILVLGIIFLFIEKKESLVKNIENKLILIFFIVIILSSLFGLSFSNSSSHWMDFITWIIIYFFIINSVNSEIKFFIFILFFLLYNFKMAQFSFLNWARIGFSFSGSGTGGGPGWFQNSGEFGIEMCIFFPIAFYFILAIKDNLSVGKKIFFVLFPIFAIGGWISSSSRGALLGGAATLLWILLKSKYKIKGIFTTAILAILIFYFIPEEQLDRFSVAGSESDRTSQTRIERWAKGIQMAKMYPIFGVGYENWKIADEKIFNGDGAECHNIFVECISELGYSGLIFFIIMILFIFVNNYNTRKHAIGSNNIFLFYMAHGLDAALIGYMVSGFFVTVLYYPYFWINLAMTVSLNNIAKKNRNYIG